MNIIDYTGKLNSHEQYLKILNKIEPKCNYILFTTTHEGYIAINDEIL